MNAKKITITLKEVSLQLGINHMVVKEMIRSGRLPIGTVIRPEGSNHDRIIIPRKRWEAWKNKQDFES